MLKGADTDCIHTGTKDEVEWGVAVGYFCIINKACIYYMCKCLCCVPFPLLLNILYVSFEFVAEQVIHCVYAMLYNLIRLSDCLRSIHIHIDMCSTHADTVRQYTNNNKSRDDTDFMQWRNLQYFHHIFAIIVDLFRYTLWWNGFSELKKK